jgi:hypothetical protein
MNLKMLEQQDQLRAGRIQATREQAVSCMSNAKWRRLLQIVADTGMKFPISEWCFLRNERRYRFETPEPDCCLGDGSGIGDVSAMGPFLFRDVFFVHWPRHYQIERRGQMPLLKSQEVDVLHGALVDSGQFELKLDQAGLTLWGYRFPQSSTADNVV